MDPTDSTTAPTVITMIAPRPRPFVASVMDSPLAGIAVKAPVVRPSPEGVAAGQSSLARRRRRDHRPPPSQGGRPRPILPAGADENGGRSRRGRVVHRGGEVWRTRGVRGGGRGGGGA